jgi:hypothetical protein
MKKFFTLLAVVILTFGSAFAQELTVSGELKTGIYWERKQEGDKEAEEQGKVHNNDDAGNNEGRFRLNIQLDKENIGMKVRLEQTQWNYNGTISPRLPYAFAYGNFLDDQIKISGGMLGDSPWGAGGPERWDELDTRIGIRTEIKPKIVPGLNVGFVLNDWNQGLGINSTKRTIGEMLKETVLGASYDHEYFALRFAYRLDSELDDNADRLDEGSQMLYRAEERILQKYLEGMQIWANGYYDGIKSKKGLVFYNWIYFQYAPDAFTAQLRVGLDASDEERKVLHVRPSFYYHFFNKLLTAGLAFSYCQDFESKYSEGSLYQYFRIEPQLKLNLSNTAIALVYQYENRYTSQDVITQLNWINLRLVYAF